MKTVALTSSTIDKGYKLYSRYVQYVLKGAQFHGIPVLPVILPFTDDPAVIRGYAHAFDGYLFTGGDDVSPRAVRRRAAPPLRGRGTRAGRV